MATWVSQHEKCKTVVECNEARDDRMAMLSAGPCFRQMTTPAPHHSICIDGPDALPNTQTTASDYWRLM